jgi:hypothetical protein
MTFFNCNNKYGYYYPDLYYVCITSWDCFITRSHCNTGPVHCFVTMPRWSLAASASQADIVLLSDCNTPLTAATHQSLFEMVRCKTTTVYC